MKFFAALLLCTIALFLVQPIFASHANKKCIKTCCPESGRDKKECPKSCNPFFTCIYCQYLPAKNILIKEVVYNSTSKHQKDFDANILKGYYAVCWHPPNRF